MNTDELLREHAATLLEAVTLRDLPKKEIHEMEDGGTVVKHHLRYANFFKEVCLD